MMTYLSGGCIFCKSRHWSVSTWRLKSGFFCSMSRNTIKQFYCERHWGRVAVTTTHHSFLSSLFFTFILFSNIVIVHECWKRLARGSVRQVGTEKPIEIREDSVCLRENAIFNKHRFRFVSTKGKFSILCYAKENAGRWPNSLKLPSLYCMRGGYGNRQLSIFIIWNLLQDIYDG